ncbi:MAG: family 43 glycosylhydrolase, partial [Duncaniella sp.]|nr:family 43 glycosylhydrolase [Duncaniella sp.]
YVSDNLTDWTPLPPVFTKKDIQAHGLVGWVGRLGVAYLPEVKLYVLMVQHNDGVLVATSDSPAGPFLWSHEINMTSRIGTPNTGDQTVFIDPDDGASYLIYSYGKGRHRQYVSRIGMKDGRPDLLDCVQVCKGASREGNCMFKHKGKYYMVASNIYGWDGSLTYYVCADNIYGPYLPVNDMQVMEGSREDYSHISQTGFFYTLNGSDTSTVIFCGDRWAEFAGNGLGYNQWMPLSFDGDIPYLNSLHSWELNGRTGTWRVSDDNNYVKNGSFEADRRTVPLSVKPRQDALTGWSTAVLRGNRVEVDRPDSPQLNYFNTREDRQCVIGEKSLCISDKIPFERVVTQIISSTPLVPLPDGEYMLSAMAKITPGFSRLEMFASSASGDFEEDLTGLPAGQWQKINLPVAISGGKVLIGFTADGDGGATCLIDDVELVRVLTQ